MTKPFACCEFAGGGLLGHKKNKKGVLGGGLGGVGGGGGVGVCLWERETST